MVERWSADQSRKILKRIIVEGDLVLQTSAHFGNGEGGDLTDMPLLMDAYEGKPLLLGTSLAGALRNYLLYWELGDRLVNNDSEDDRYWVDEEIAKTTTVKLFGTDKRGDGIQSALIVEDALGIGEDYFTEIRDGVGIDPKSRTAGEEKLYDTQFWQAGTTFHLRFELILAEDVVFDEDLEEFRPESESEFKARVKDIKQALATALYGLETGEITLGMRKHRGFGQVRVEGWRVRIYDMTNANDIVEWVVNGGNMLPKTIALTRMEEMALGIELLPDNRSRFELKAEFCIPYSMLIRTARTPYADDAAPDMTHLYSYRFSNDEPVPIISGTALAGVLRARAGKIAELFSKSDLIDDLFGDDVEATKQRNLKNGNQIPIRSSRLRTFEAVIDDHAETNLVQNRVKIDRFTGGAYPTALFNQKPLFGNREARVALQIDILSPIDAEIGLLLLLLKDLWTEDLAIGGESSVGRGRLNGKWAELDFHILPDCFMTITLEQLADGTLEMSADAESLEHYVEQFCEGA